MKTLLVEDNPADARLIREMLKEHTASTFEVQHVTRLDLALECLREETFDVLLLDLGLPDAQGMETLNVTHKAWGGLPIVVLTGLDDEQLALESMRAGAQDYLVKGRFDTQLLVRTIRYAVKRKQAEDEVRRLNAELEMRVAERTLQLQAANEELQKELLVRWQAEMTLRKSQAKLEAALASMTDSLFITDAEGRFVEFNDAYVSFLRLKSKAECPKSFDEYMALLDFETADGRAEPREMCAIQRALRGETAMNAEYTVRRKDIGETWVGSYSFAPIRDEKGTIIGSVVTARDITDRKRAEEVLRESEERLRMQMERMPIGCIVFDKHNCFSHLNPAAERILGYTAEELRGQHAYVIAPAAVRPHGDSLLRRLAEGDMTAHSENENLTKNGATILCQWINTPLRDGAGNFTGFLSMVQDVTERKRAEEALRESAKQFHDLAEGIPQLAWMTNPDGWIYWYNQRWYQYTGTTPEQMEGWGWQSVHDPNELPRVLERWKAAIASGEPWEDTFPLRGADGVFRPFLSRAFPLRDAQGRITHWFGTNTDVSGLKQAEEALRENEKRYRNLFSAMNEGFCVIEVLFDAEGKPEDFRYLEVNGSFKKQTGLHDAAGKRVRELIPDVEERWIELYGRIALTGESEHFIDEVKAINRYYDVHAYRVGEPEQRRVAVVFNDFSDYKRAEEGLQKLNRAQRARSRSSQALLYATNEQEFLDEVCTIIVEDCGHRMVWIGVAEHDEKKSVRVLAHAGYEAGYIESLHVTWGEDEHGRGPTGASIRSGRPVICHDMLSDPAFAPWREEAIERGYASVIAVPFKLGDRDWGEFSIYSGERDAFSEAEVELLTELASDVEFGVQSLRLRAAHARAEKEVARSREMLGLFVDNAPVAMAMFDREMRYLRSSRRWRSDHGLADRPLAGLSHYEVFPDISEQRKQVYWRGLAGESLGSAGERFDRADGSQQWIRWEIRPWYEAEGSVGGIVILTEDITERKKAEAALLESERLALQREQLRALAERLEKAREEERTRVARDLHDDIGQILTAVKMDLQWIGRHEANQESEVRRRLEGAVELIGDGMHSVRKICAGLRPSLLDDLGLAAAIEWQANEFSTRTGIANRLSLPAAKFGLSTDHATVFFRVFQECLTNVSRHAQARAVDVSLYDEGEDVVLVVKDDGKGFREDALTTSLGILGMKERAQSCGGELSIASSDGMGTAVTLRIPLRADGSKDDAHFD